MSKSTEIKQKVKAFDEYLKEKDLKWFSKEEYDDTYKTVAYRSTLELSLQKLPLLVILDETLFTMIRVVVASGKVDDEAKAGIDAYLGNLNARYKSFKYYVSEAKDGILLDVSVPCTAEDFNPELILGLIGQVVLPHLEEQYPLIMENAWKKPANMTKAD